MESKVDRVYADTERLGCMSSNHAAWDMMFDCHLAAGLLFSDKDLSIFLPVHQAYPPALLTRVRCGHHRYMSVFLYLLDILRSTGTQRVMSSACMFIYVFSGWTCLLVGCVFPWLEISSFAERAPFLTGCVLIWPDMSFSWTYPLLNNLATF